MEDCQWQWLIDQEGKLIYSNYYSSELGDSRNTGITIRNIDQIYNDLLGDSGHRIHKIEIDGESRDFISTCAGDTSEERFWR
ncbi:MAG: hypothetical protein R2727_06470 [Bacteroidales bacterium]